MPEGDDEDEVNGAGEKAIDADEVVADVIVLDAVDDGVGADVDEATTGEMDDNLNGGMLGMN